MTTHDGHLSRRTLLVSGATVGVVTLGGVSIGSSSAAFTGRPSGGPDAPVVTELTPFLAALPMPRRATPNRIGGIDQFDIPILNATHRLHPQLPSTPLWTFGGSFPGPIIDVRQRQRIRIAWRNELSGTIPVMAVETPNVGSPWNTPGRSGAMPRPDVAALPPWTAVHLHGALTSANNDGWPENVIPPGDSQLSEYPNDQPATALFYHDHAMSITRWTVFAGLVGAYLIRDDEEDQLNLPRGGAEIPLMICDRNFDTDEDGRLTGALLHKTTLVNNTGWQRAFTGPFTLVNGVVWPYKDVPARWRRLRLFNAANTRQYYLRLLDEGGTDVPMYQIGTDGGLLDAPVELHTGIRMGVAERADVLVDFGPYRGQRLQMINAETAPDPGPWPHVMQFRVGTTKVSQTFTLPQKLSPSFARVGKLPSANPPERLVLLTPMGPSQAVLWEMAKVASPAGPLPVDGIVQFVEEDGTLTTYQRQAMSFADPGFTVLANSWEQWRFLHVASSGWPHPMHVHATSFQILRRQTLNVSGFTTISNPEGRTGFGTRSPITIASSGPALPGETGWKDTVRVQAAEMVTIAAKFGRSSGKYVYHCHMLEHEDMGMMRQFRVLPSQLNDIEHRDNMGM